MSENPTMCCIKLDFVPHKAYFSLLELLSSFRQSSYPIRLTNLELPGQTDGYVGYSYMIECSISDPELQRQKDQTTEKAELQ